MAGSAPLSEHPPVEHPEVRSAIDLLEAWIEAQRVARELPGVSLGIVHDQALVWSGGFGWADVERREPATADTLYRIGSITKLFTATALLILRDAGKLHLDDPLATHLPWFQMKAAAAEAGTITIRHLLTHTSGLPREGAFPYSPTVGSRASMTSARGCRRRSARSRPRPGGSTPTSGPRSPARWWPRWPGSPTSTSCAVASSSRSA